MFPDVVQHPLLSGFEMLGRLGAGASGQVYLAKSRAGRKVAIKILREPKAGEEEAFSALAREATLCVRLSHPAIVQVRAFIEGDGLAALVLDYVEGPPLARLMRLAGVVGARLPDRVAWHTVERILAGLAYAHSQQDESGTVAPIVHRDLSPSNVLLDWSGDVKITDFGIAKMLGVSPATRYGLVKGTLGCMAPEQARGEPVDQRADVYAAALLAWRLATGRLPFDPRLPEPELLRAMRYPKLRPLSALRSDLPPELLVAVDVALSPGLLDRTLGATELHRIVVSSMDVDRGRTDLRDLLDRWRAHLERVKAQRDGGSRTTDSSGDKKLPTLKYEEVDVLEEDYPMDGPTIEAHALPEDDAAWAIALTPFSQRGGALPTLRTLTPMNEVPAETTAREVLKLELPRLLTPIALQRPMTPKPRPRWERVAVVVVLAFLVAALWMLKTLP